MAFPQFRPSVYGSMEQYIRNAIEAIDRAPFSFLSFFLYGDYRSSKVIENKRTLNEIVGATHVRFGFVDRGWKCRIFKFLSCEIMFEGKMDLRPLEGKLQFLVYNFLQDVVKI